MQNALAFLQLLINYQSFSYLRLTYVETCQDKAVNYYHLNDIDTYFFSSKNRNEMRSAIDRFDHDILPKFKHLIDYISQLFIRNDVHISMVGNLFD